MRFCTSATLLQLLLFLCYCYLCATVIVVLLLLLCYCYCCVIASATARLLLLLCYCYSCCYCQFHVLYFCYSYCCATATTNFTFNYFSTATANCYSYPSVVWSCSRNIELSLKRLVDKMTRNLIKLLQTIIFLGNNLNKKKHLLLIFIKSITYNYLFKTCYLNDADLSTGQVRKVNRKLSDFIAPAI
jgi:hypothetical protein